jgi:hypothetical protein
MEMLAMSARTLLALVCAILLATTVLLAGHDQTTEETSFLPADHPAIRYNEARLEDPVTRLDRALESGKVKLDFDATFGYLPSLLKNLGVHADSQMLVFSKTSFQAAKISPHAPRAIFFSDDVTIGSVQNGDVLEFAALDPRQGVVFYTFDRHESDQPRFVRRDVCLQCHQGPATLGVPGIMIASVYTDSSGMPAFRLGEPVTDHRTPFQDRWGGWYVNGTHGGMRHKGNAVARDPRQPDLLETQGTQNLTSLARKFDTATYISPVSDIVALLTLEHQTRMTNLMTRVAWEARIAQHDGKTDDPQARGRLDADIETLVTYMLFTDEAVLYDPVEGVSTFTKTFPQRGPRDRQGRSLRDFDLQKRLFRYPLSYMIYTPAFEAIPGLARDRIYQRLYDVLTGKDQSKKLDRLSAEDRRAIVEIVRDTKPNLPAYWANP